MSAVVKAARAWVGTPYVHQASVRGSGTDCLGLLLGVWRDVFPDAPSEVPAYTSDWMEPSGREQLWNACGRHLEERDLHAETSGDVILFRMRDRSVAKHLGIQTEIGPRARFVHAYAGHGVVETSLSAPWHRRIVARFAFPFDQSRSA